jgi:hypothetical protein
VGRGWPWSESLTRIGGTLGKKCIVNTQIICSLPQDLSQCCHGSASVG